MPVGSIYTVTTLNDGGGDDFNGGDLIAETADGGGLSLREALALANDGDAIEFDGALIGGTVTLASGELSIIQDDFIIDGDIDDDGAADITIDAAGASRVFSIAAGIGEADTNDVELDGLAIVNGAVSGNGGGVYAGINTNTILRNTLISANTTTNGGDGGGVFAGSGSLKVYGGAIYGNSAAGDGGGISTGATGYFFLGLYETNLYLNQAAVSGGGVGLMSTVSEATIFGSSIDDNSANNGGGVYSKGDRTTIVESRLSENTAFTNAGGAMFTSGDVDIANSLISGNSAVPVGGGLYFASGVTEADVVNTTIAGNYALFLGGGVFSDTAISIANSTITGNRILVTDGGGVATTTALTLTNSIVAGNEGFGVDDLNTSSLYQQGGNIIGTNIYSGGVDVGDTTLADVFGSVGANPDTGVYSGLLADNGGRWFSIALKYDGDAVDAGDGAYLPADPYDLDSDANTAEDLPVDTRGEPRVAGAEVDLGAVEMQLVVTTLDDEAYDGGDLVAEAADGGGLSLREAIALAQDGNEITFDASLAGGTLNLALGTLTITNSLTVNGDVDGDDVADITISGDANGDDLTTSDFWGNIITDVSSNTNTSDNIRVFYTAAGSSGVLNGLVVTGGVTTGGNGGGIYGLLSTLTVSNSSISGNKASGYGGGISANSLSLYVSDSLISQNEAGVHGGGLAHNNLTVLENVTVTYNGASGNGGGIWNSGSISVENGRISNNEAGIYGGGIHNATGTVAGVSLEVVNNYAVLSSGGISNSIGTVTLANSTVSGNSTTGLGGGVGSDGTLNLANVSLVGNTAGTYGGGLARVGGDAYIDSSTFTGNYAGQQGGGLYSVASGDLQLANSIVTGNDAGVFADDTNGLVNQYGANIIGTDIFSGNSDVGDTALADVFLNVGNNPDTGVYSGLLADNGGPVQTVMIKYAGDAHDAGDGAYLPADPLDLDNDANTAEDLPTDARGAPRVSGGYVDLGAVEFAEAASPLIVTTLADGGDDDYDGGDILSETADGGGLSLREALALAGDGDVIEFDASLSGGAIHLQSGELVISNDITVDGDIDNDNTPDITISGDANADDSTITDGWGDAITDVETNTNTGDNTNVLSVTSGSAVLNGLVITGGVAGSYLYAAGVTVDNGASATIQNSSLSGHFQSQSGGGLTNFGEVWLYNVLVSHNHSVGSGGGVYNPGVLYVYDSEISHNTSDFRAGAILNSGALYLHDSQVNENFSGGDAGAISNGGAEGDATIINSTIANNTAIGWGGGLISSGYFTLINTTVSGNYAYDGGGGVALFGGVGSFANSTVSDNGAANDGGGIHNEGYIYLTNTTLAENTSGGLGGGLYTGGNVAQIANSTISGNSAAGNGGGIAVSNLDAVFLTNSIVAGNEGAEGVDDVLGSGYAPRLELYGQNVLGSTPVGFSVLGYDAGKAVILGTGNSFSLSDVFSHLDPANGGGLLADNGGPVSTIAIKNGGVAHNTGDGAYLAADDNDLDGDLDTLEALPVDARGFDRLVDSDLDIGAAELQVLVVTTTLDGGDDDYDGGSLEDETADGGGLSLREALALVQDGDTITFDMALSGETITLAGTQLTVEKSVTIDGDLDDDNGYDITVDADGASRVLQIAAGADESNPNVVVIDGLMITGGYLDSGVDSGAGVQVAQDVELTIVDSRISANNSIYYGSAGGVYVIGNSTLNVFDSEIVGNNATYYGGGIAAMSSDATIFISNSEISHNDALQGGGIYSRGTMTITGDSVVYMNSASYGAGVMSAGDLTINEGSIVSSNIAPVGGGGVFVSGTATFSNASFVSNFSGYGGAIFLASGSASVDASYIANNTATQRGGGVYADTGVSLYISDSYIAGNSANANGGGLMLDGNSAGTVVNTTFANNSSGYGGAAAIREGGVLDAANATFYGNSATYDGGAINNLGGSVDLRNSTFTGNKGFTAGAIDGDATAANSIFAGNSGNEGTTDHGYNGALTSNGGNVFGQIGLAGGYDVHETDLSEIFSDVVTNSFTGVQSGALGSNGGAWKTVQTNPMGVAIDIGDSGGLPADELDIDGDLDTLEDLPLDARGAPRNSGANVDAGAVEVTQYVVTTNLDGGTDEFNGGDLATETADGGGLSLREALALAQDGSIITFDAGLSGMTVSAQESGAFHIEHDNLLIDGDLNNDGVADVTIQGNGATRALYVVGNTEAHPNDVTLDGLNISGGVLSGGYGAGILVNPNTALTLNNVNVTDNEGGYGAGVAVLGSSTLAIYGGSVSGNNSGGYSGGGLFVGNNAQATIDGATFYSNSGTIGGGVLSFGALAIYNSTFDQNGATSRGGAVAAYGDTDIADSAFTDNTVNNVGGAVYSAYNSIEITNSTFENNSTSIGSGGALYLYESASNIANSLFAGNEANGLGGAVYSGGGGETKVVNSTFYGNFSNFGGGGIGQRTGELFLYSSTFTGNYAEGGGAVQVDGASAHAYSANTLFAGNGDVGSTEDVYTNEGGTFASLGGNLFKQSGMAGESDVEFADLDLIFEGTVTNAFTGMTSGALADNGGPTETVAILAGGGADDGGQSGALPPDFLDLDGDANTFEDLPLDATGGPRVLGGQLDIGAVAVELMTVYGTPGDDTLAGVAARDIIDGLAGNDVIDGMGGDDTLIGGVGEDTLDGGDGDDSLTGDASADVLNGGIGEDTLHGGIGDDTLNGGDDDDLVEGWAGRDSMLGGNGDDFMHGYNSHDSLYGGNGNDDLRGGYGKDLLNGSGNNDVLRGFEGDDRLFGGGGNDTLLGNDDNDSLTGGGGVDRLKGDAGDDTLNGRFGDDSVTGGAGDDLFEFRLGHGNDIYDDFVAGAGTDDVIELIAFGAAFDSFAEVIAAASDNGTHTTIDFGGGDSIKLLNVVVAALHEDDFVFS